MALKSPRFAPNARLQQAANNAPALNGADSGQSVRIVQQALIDLGFPLPISTQKYGTPDGWYGKETKDAVKEFQFKHGLTIDGLAGKQTMGKLDELLPTNGVPLPPLPTLVPFNVFGIMDPIRQKSQLACWATSYTMMINWKKQQSLEVREAIVPLGKKWVDLLDYNIGLSPFEGVAFANATGLKFEPLQSLSVDAWAMLLRDYGLLWLGYGWQQAGLNGLPTKKGRHAIVIRGIVGDGTPEGTEIRFMDPTDGMFRKESFLEFIDEFELGFTLDPMNSNELKGFAQLIHF